MYFAIVIAEASIAVAGCCCSDGEGGSANRFDLSRLPCGCTQTYDNRAQLPCSNFSRFDKLERMKHEFTSVIEKRGKWFVAYVEEIPGVNTSP